jgi:outer membrane protein OmpA-like peptidoglycan-associated protein
MDLRFSRFEVLTTTGSFFVSLLFICVFVEAADIEQSLTVATADAVREHGLYWVGVEPSGMNMVLTGAAPDLATRSRAGRLAAAVPGVDRVDNRITIAGEAAGRCQAALDERLAGSGVTFFRRGLADLADASLPLLTELAGIMRDCGARVEVASHTNAEGDAGINLKLSQRRADAVRKALVQRGVSPARLDAVGYGEAQPVAPSADAEGRARNDRLEFRVIGEPA